MALVTGASAGVGRCRLAAKALAAKIIGTSGRRRS
jgi:hypothetical protein